MQSTGANRTGILAKLGLDISGEVDKSLMPILMAKELSAFKQVAPFLLAFNVLLLILGAMLLDKGGPGLPQIVWLAALGATILAGAVMVYRHEMKVIAAKDIIRHHRDAIISALAFGALYGLMPHVWLSGEVAPLRTGGVAGIAGMLSLAAIVLSTIPAAAFAFLAPAIALVGAWLALHATPFQTAAGLAAMAALLPIAAIAARQQRRGFNANVRREKTIREQRLIIGMLLKEFDPHSANWLWEVDASNRLLRVSSRFREVAEAGRELTGVNFFEFLRSIGGDAALDGIEDKVSRREMFSEVELQLAIGGRERWWRLTGKPIYCEDGLYSGYIGAASDITEQKISENRIAFLAHNDPLTGLANRARFTESLNHCVARLERYGTPFAVLFLDLDNFKLVNDSRGHMVGDRLLSQVAQKLREEVRETDIVARVGGDEFAILMTDENDPEKVSNLAERLIAKVGCNYAIDGEIASVGLSVGIALAPNNGTRANQILRNADLALYRAKEDGRGVARFFEIRMDADNRERRLLENEMRQALVEGEFELYFQPVVGTESRRPVGFEALVRWNHPMRGTVSPAEFIPIAEQTGLICEIGDWTIHEACRTAATWPDGLTVAVNMSAKHFQNSDIVQVVRSALQQSGLSANRLEIEVTESLLIKNQDEVRAKLESLREIGATIALDDFGTGYSSLSYLLKFPFDKIKIDKSFVDASSTDITARDILRTIAALGSTLQMKVTAEGVETPDQVEFLREIACHHLQGYFFAKPLKVGAIAPYLLDATVKAAAAQEAERQEAAALRREIRRIA